MKGYGHLSYEGKRSHLSFAHGRTWSGCHHAGDRAGCVYGEPVGGILMSMAPTGRFRRKAVILPAVNASTFLTLA